MLLLSSINKHDPHPSPGDIYCFVQISTLIESLLGVLNTLKSSKGLVCFCLSVEAVISAGCVNYPALIRIPTSIIQLQNCMGLCYFSCNFRNQGHRLLCALGMKSDNSGCRKRAGLEYFASMY